MCDRTTFPLSLNSSFPEGARLGLFRLLFGIVVLAASGCTADQDPLFIRLDAEQTGIDFVNRIATDDSLMNPLDFFYVYNGGGVGAGDVNGDGRPDLYFTGNTGPNRLYLNQGGFQFRDVTDAAGVAARGVWSTGVTLADVNQDGRMDIYVSVGGPTEVTDGRANRLYINQGTGGDDVPTFEERAEAYGVADTGYSTHAAFFDYDRDGDLDLYVLNTATVTEERRVRFERGRREAIAEGSADHLYRNNGDPGSSPGQAPPFTEVAREAGIRFEGYGLGLAISDVSGDGWPDIYVANDLHTRDRLYVNNSDGTFTDRSGTYLKHQSYRAMGVDIADFNNDRWGDIMVLDMLPKDPPRRRVISNVGAKTDGMWQYGRNTLQLNNGVGPKGTIAFSEIGQLAGVEATGWSWAPLLADYDNDGDRDLFVSNGYGEFVTHLDFVERQRQAWFSRAREQHREALFEALDDLPQVPLINRWFENKGGAGTKGKDALQFTERTDDWATDRPGISNGAAFVDLDRDGDLDLVTNNINDEAAILENRTNEQSRANALRVNLHGPKGNREGIGARVVLTNDGTTQYHYHSPYRGYQSTVESVIHFGLGADSTADSLKVIWPDGSSQWLTDVRAGQVLDVRYDPAAEPSRGEGGGSSSSSSMTDRYLFQESAAQRGLGYRHREAGIMDFQINPLLPYRYSQNGPGIVVGEVDGNDLDDVFVGSDLRQQSVLFRQVEPGLFQKRKLPFGARHDDMGALLFDADGDGDQDLYVVSGGNAGPPDNAEKTYQDRLYLNDGKGDFTRAPDALPDMTASGSSVIGADYDRDGDLDLFVGGRIRARNYPLPPRSYLLRNDSGEDGVQFTDVTPSVAPGLAEVGLVTDALWTDFSGDGQVDLIVVGEWMPITFFKNNDGQLVDVTGDVGLEDTSGWWSSLAAGDFDRDGDTDYVAGNLGLNTRFKASPAEPVRVHAKDFDENRTLDPVLSYYLQGTSYPAHGRREMTDQIQGMSIRFPSYRRYAEASFDEVFTESELDGAYVAEAVRFETSYLENRDDETFSIRALPMRTQIAPVFGMQAGDYDGDGHLDLLMVGNWYAPDRETGRADAFVGVFLRGNGAGRFTPVNYPESGFFVDGDAKGLAEVATGNGSPLVLATQNNDSLKAFTSSRRRGYSVRVRPLDQYAVLTFEDGATRKEEFFYGSTYLSQSSRILHVPDGVRKVTICRSDGKCRTVSIGETAASEASR